MEAVTERTTYTGGESIAERINRHISLNKKVTIASVASATGYSRTTVSRYLAGKYDADATELEAKLTAYLDTLGDVPEAEAAAPAMGKGSGKRSFYESQDARNVLGVCQSSQEFLGMGIDQSDVGLVIAGEPKLEAAIKTYLARMANRVDFYASLHGLSEQEVAEYLHGYDIAPDALEELQARARNRQTGCFRLLDRTLSNVRRILAANGGGTITLKVIQQASGMMML